MDWNKAHTDVESDVYNAEYYDTYKEAVQHAKNLCKSHAYARIDLYQLNKSQSAKFPMIYLLISQKNVTFAREITKTVRMERVKTDDNNTRMKGYLLDNQRFIPPPPTK